MFLFLLTFALVSVDESLQTNLTFLFITSFGQHGFNSSGVVPAADIALEDINADPDVLSGYNLVYDEVRDSQCQQTPSQTTFFDGILTDKKQMLAVIGCGCSVATEPIAEISHLWNIPHISYASSSPALSDRNIFKSFFRNTFNMNIIAPALRSAVVYFNWSRILILSQDEALFYETDFDVMNELEAHGISVESELFHTGDVSTEFLDETFMDEESYRIIFLNSYSEPAREIICYALRHEYSYPKYVWILYDWYPDEWWTSDNDTVESDCTGDMLAEFLENALTIQVPDVDDGVVDFGSSRIEFDEIYGDRARELHYNTTDRTYAYKLYDVLWVLALALNDTDDMIRSGDINGTGCEGLRGALVALENFKYRNMKVGCLIQWNIQNTNFSGLSGRVTFDQKGSRTYTLVNFRQYKMLEGRLVKTLIGQTDANNNHIFTLAPGIGVSDIYPDGVPKDGTPIQTIHTFQTGLVVTCDILASLGILFAIFCLIFNFTFRNKKTVKLSSPNLNYFIILGAILMYTSIFFYLLPTTSEDIVKMSCVVEFWLFAIGYSFAFGTVLVKLWRVYQIFHDPQPNKTVLTDWKLIIVVLVISGVTLFLLALGESIPFLRGNVLLTVDEEHNSHGTASSDIQEIYFIWICQESSTPSFYWQMIVFAYLFVLQIVGLVLAFQTRKVKLSGLRDSKYVAAIVYISTVSIVVMTVIALALENYINSSAGIFAFGIFSMTTIFLALVFVPKMVLIYRDFHGRSSEDHPLSGPGVSLQPHSRDSTETELSKKLSILEKEVKEKEETITELRRRIEKLDISGDGNSSISSQ